MIPERMRWLAEVTYRTEAGDNPVYHAFDELEDLHDIIERGPNFYSIKRITIEPQPLEGVTGRTLEDLEAE